MLSIWQSIIQDEEVLQAVQGLPIKFEELPKQYATYYHEHILQEQELVSNEINKLLTQGVIKHTSHEEGEIILPIFITEKSHTVNPLISARGVY